MISSTSSFSSGFQLILLLFTFFHQLASFSAVAQEANGFGENINWIDYDSAIADSSRPTLVILHKSWCSACKSLKPKLAQSFDFEKLSGKFSMVNAKEDNPVSYEKMIHVFYLNHFLKYSHLPNKRAYSFAVFTDFFPLISFIRYYINSK